MSSSEPLQVQVTPVVFDFLFIEVKTKIADDTLIQYSITDSENRLIRKGSFKGMFIQMRLPFLKEGHYRIELIFGNFDPLVFSFEKKTENNPDGTRITIY